jgi:hypothetical protein
VRRRQDAKFANRDAQSAADDEQTAPAAPAEPAAAPATTDPLERLKTLGELKESGVLTEAEFEAQKAKILAG